MCVCVCVFIHTYIRIYIYVFTQAHIYSHRLMNKHIHTEYMLAHTHTYIHILAEVSYVFQG